jgi:hypothetical protein
MKLYKKSIFLTKIQIVLTIPMASILTDNFLVNRIKTFEHKE